MQASLKKFMDYIQTSAVDKMVKFIDKGLDPNYQDSDTGGKEYRAWGLVASPLSFSIFLHSQKSWLPSESSAETSQVTLLNI